jgi:hypothetical protein
LSYLLEVEFDEFGWRLINEEAERQHVSVEDLVRHAALYFAADRDGASMSRRVSPFKDRSFPPDESRAATDGPVEKVKRAD